MIDTLTLIAYTISAFGFAVILGHSRASLPFRNMLAWLATIKIVGPFAELLLEMIECPLCLGFWTGLLTSRVLYGHWQHAIFAGCYVAGANYVLGRLTSLIEREPS